MTGGKVYYGWFIVLAAFLAMFTTSAVTSNSQSVFLVPMTKDLGWSRADFTWGQTIGTFFMSAAGFVVGSYVDAKGPRMFMFAGAAFLSVIVITMSQVHELWQYLVLRGAGMTLGSIMIGNLVVNTTVSKWFVRRRAWAITMSTIGLSLAGFAAPIFTSALVDAHGWRTAWVVLGVGLLFLVLPSAALMRRRPEDYGLLPDGDDQHTPIDTSNVRVVTHATEVQWTREEAIRTRAFWLLVASFCLVSFGTGSFSLHTVSYLQDSGYSASDAAARFSLVYLFTASSRPIWGSVMQRVSPRYCAALGFLVTSCAMVGMIFALGSGSGILLYFFMTAWGLGFGGFVPLQELIWATYFGRQHIGRVRSVAIPMLGICMAIGPQLAARVYDATGGYGYAFAFFATCSASAALCIVFAKPPRPEQRRRPATAGEFGSATA
jgi:MFS family permease